MMCRRDLSPFGLTRREEQVVDAIARGREIKETVRELGIGYQTVKMHIARAKAKMRARNQIEVAIIAHGGVPQSWDATPAQEPPRAERAIEQAPIWQVAYHGPRR